MPQDPKRLEYGWDTPTPREFKTPNTKTRHVKQQDPPKRQQDKSLIFTSVALDYEDFKKHMSKDYTPDKIFAVIDKLQDRTLNIEHTYGPIGKIKRAWQRENGDVMITALVFAPSSMVGPKDKIAKIQADHEDLLKEIERGVYGELSVRFNFESDYTEDDNPLDHPNFTFLEVSMVRKGERPVGKIIEMLYSGISHMASPRFF